MRRLIRRLIVASTYAHPVLLVVLCLAFVLVGERWWLSAALLYAPRVFYAAPSLLLIPALLWLRERRLLWTQAAALLLTVGPLMGLVLPWPVAGAGVAPSLKLLSFNIDASHGADERLLDVIDSVTPDLLLLQETPWDDALPAKLRERFPYVEHASQFIAASRFPILEHEVPSKLAHFGKQRSSRYVRYLVDTNLGKLAVYNLHPISPRGALGVYRLRDAAHGVKAVALPDGDAETDLEQNASLRWLHVEAAARAASHERFPVLLAGDTNLPGLSAALHRHLSGYQDGFRQASWGFGYTFPRRYPFLRLDRVLASRELRFEEFQVGCPTGVSDHLCVIARLTRR